jgi:transcriptional regulator with XRE-family HTH domain
MKLHANARLSVKGRELLIERLRAGWSLAQAATAAGVSERTARKWRERHRAEGVEGLLDRSSAPQTVPARTPEDRIQAIAALRRLRLTGAEIAEVLGMALSTVSGILARIGMGKLGRVGFEPAQRYRPQTNGKAERFIRTMLAGWAYGAIYRDSRERTAALSGWLKHYSYRRPHGSLSHQPPVSRLHQLTGNNLPGPYT